MSTNAVHNYPDLGERVNLVGGNSLGLDGDCNLLAILTRENMRAKILRVDGTGFSIPQGVRYVLIPSPNVGGLTSYAVCSADRISVWSLGESNVVFSVDGLCVRRAIVPGERIIVLESTT